MKKAQGILDYTIFLAVFCAAVMLIGIYVRNGMSGKIRESADIFGGGETYVPNVNATGLSASEKTKISPLNVTYLP